MTIHPKDLNTNELKDAQSVISLIAEPILRDVFAAFAMAAIVIANNDEKPFPEVASQAYSIAEMMMAERQTR